MKSIKPNDLGTNGIVEWNRRININDLIRQANREAKNKLVQSLLDINGVDVSLDYTKTRFGGLRAWFVCPVCGCRVGSIFQGNSLIACRKCLGMKYKAQRFGNMLEMKKA